MTADDPEVVRKEDDPAARGQYVAAVNARVALIRRYGSDALIVLVALASVLEVGLRAGAKLPKTSYWVALPAVAVLVLVLLGWRRHGFAAGAALWLFAAGLSAVDGRLVTGTTSIQVAGLAAAYLLGNTRDLRQAQVGLAIVLVCALIIVSNDARRTGGEFVFVPTLFGIGWVAGFVLRQRMTQGEAAEARASQLEREQEERAHKAIAEERARIARELHDVVGHCVSVMTLQASAVRRVLPPEQDSEREALTAVEKVGREALVEMRRLVGILRDCDAEPDLAPPPSLRDLDTLIERTRASGLAVDLEVDEFPLELPASIDLTAYRIVQEGLTNTIRHAHARTAHVRIQLRSGSLDIEISDDGIGVSGTPRPAGNGLLGMGERVDVFGGHLEAGPSAHGGYRLRARLPVAT